MDKYPLIRKIYLYLFSIVGLVMVIVGTVNFIDMGFKAFIFTSAEEQERIDYSRPISADTKFLEPKLEANQTSGTPITMTKEEADQVRWMMQDYKAWQERQKAVDYVTARRSREASTNLAVILVGVPLYLYHWLTIRREMKNVG